MEREAVEHLLNRTRTDTRLAGFGASSVTDDVVALEMIMLADGVADMISVGRSGARGNGRSPR